MKEDARGCLNVQFLFRMLVEQFSLPSSWATPLPDDDHVTAVLIFFSEGAALGHHSEQG